MRQKPTSSGYQDRLAQALERGPRPMSVRGLHQGLEDRFPDLRGTSYGGVRHYVEGKVTSPRVELLRAMAEVLGVRPDWLAFGEGPMTEEEARLAEDLDVGEVERREAARRRELRDAFTRGFPPFPRLGALARTAMMEVANRISVYSESFGDEPPELPGPWALAGPDHDLERAEAVGRMFMAAFEALRLDPRTLRALDRYVALQAQALLTMIPDRAQGEEGARFSPEKSTTEGGSHA